MSILRYYTAKEVVLITGVSYRRLDYWVRKGIVCSSGRDALGRGSLRLFSFGDLVDVRVVKTLTEHGMRPTALRECIKRFRETISREDASVFSSLRLVTDGKKVFRYLSKEDKLESLDEFKQFAFTFGLEDQIKEVCAKAKKFEKPVRYNKQSKVCVNTISEKSKKSLSKIA